MLVFVVTCICCCCCCCFCSLTCLLARPLGRVCCAVLGGPRVVDQPVAVLPSFFPFQLQSGILEDTVREACGGDFKLRSVRRNKTPNTRPCICVVFYFVCSTLSSLQHIDDWIRLENMPGNERARRREPYAPPFLNRIVCVCLSFFVLPLYRLYSDASRPSSVVFGLTSRHPHPSSLHPREREGDWFLVDYPSAEPNPSLR